MKNTEIIIHQPGKFQISVLEEVWVFRELLIMLAWRDIKVRYKQTILGVLWVVLQPLVSTAIFTFFFGRVASISSNGFPYSFFVFSGLTIWNYFSIIVTRGSDAMVENQHIIKKVYFPKIILILSIVLSGSVDFLISSGSLILIGIVFGFYPSISLFWIYPFVAILIIISGVALALFLSALNVKFRDVRYILPFAMQLLIFTTPVIYPLSIVDSRNRILLALNPVTSAMELLRSAFSTDYPINPVILGTSIVFGLGFLVGGFIFFTRVEHEIADLV